MSITWHVDPEETIKSLKKQVGSLKVALDNERDLVEEAFYAGFWAGWEDDSGKPDASLHWQAWRSR